MAGATYTLERPRKYGNSILITFQSEEKLHSQLWLFLFLVTLVRTAAIVTEQLGTDVSLSSPPTDCSSTALLQITT